jgi:hypothetical protein
VGSPEIINRQKRITWVRYPLPVLKVTIVDYRNKLKINSYQIRFLLRNAAELGVLVGLIKCGKVKPYVKKSEAYRKFGRNTVEIWISERLITPRKDGNHSSNWRIDRLQLETLGKSVEILRYLNQFYGPPTN